jgi:hypothetical protein
MRQFAPLHGEIFLWVAMRVAARNLAMQFGSREKYLVPPF